MKVLVYTRPKIEVLKRYPSNQTVDPTTGVLQVWITDSNERGLSTAVEIWINKAEAQMLLDQFNNHAN